MKMKKHIRIFWGCLSIIMLLSVFTGCNSDNAPNSGNEGSSNGATAVTMPIVKEPITLKWWYPIAPQDIQSWNDSIVFKEMANRSNITMQFEIPTGNAAQQ